MCIYIDMFSTPGNDRGGSSRGPNHIPALSSPASPAITVARLGAEPAPVDKMRPSSQLLFASSRDPWGASSARS